jgi:septal ring factor EnvC (AmiA/AmiB activator)
MIEKMQTDEDIDTLQFVVRALPCSPEERQAAWQNRYAQLLAESQIKSQINQSELQQSQQTVDRLQSELQQNQQTSTQLQSELQQIKHTSAQIQSQLKQALDRAKATIEWMETSKFWKLRNKWLKLKTLLKLER